MTGTATAILSSRRFHGETSSAPDGPPAVAIRRIPYPYRAMLAICSDLDETPDAGAYLETARFLNTTQTTRMGPGVGLEVGNTIYFDMPAEQFSYWNTDDAGRAMIRELIRSGHIDCLHSFGDLATSRQHAMRALDELCHHDCRLEVWIDHAVAPSNFGGDIMRGLGDVLGSAVFHADLTCKFGVQYVWRGRVTSVIGQDSARSLHGLYRGTHLAASARTIAKEMLKGFLARQGVVKYAMHGDNQILRPAQLRSGHRVWEFLRSNPHWGGVSRGDTAEGLAEVLTPAMLDRLLQRQGVSILYTHLGKIRRRQEPLGPRTREALALLARHAREGRILVTTTRRLLGYCRAIREVTLSATQAAGKLWIHLAASGSGPGGPLTLEDLAGLTLYVPSPRQAEVWVNGRPVPDLQRNAPDHTCRPSISLPWRPLEFPHL